MRLSAASETAWPLRVPPLATAQYLMRHSDPKPTTKVYTDSEVLDLRGAVAKLPGMAAEAAEAERVRAAANGGNDSALAPLHAPSVGKTGRRLAIPLQIQRTV